MRDCYFLAQTQNSASKEGVSLKSLRELKRCWVWLRWLEVHRTDIRLQLGTALSHFRRQDRADL